MPASEVTAAELARLKEPVTVSRIIFDLLQVALAAAAGQLQKLGADEMATELDRIGETLAELTGSPVPPRGVSKPTQAPQSPEESPR